MIGNEIIEKKSEEELKERNDEGLKWIWQVAVMHIIVVHGKWVM